MRMILLTISLIVVAAPSYAAQKPSLEKRCQDLVGRKTAKAKAGEATSASSKCNVSATA